MESLDWLSEAFKNKTALTDLSDEQIVDVMIRDLRSAFFESEVCKDWLELIKMKPKERKNNNFAIAMRSLGTLNELCSLYGLELEVLTKDEGPNSGKISGTKVQEKELDFIVPLIILEWSLYPVSLIKKINIKALSIGREWFVSDQYRFAVPDWFDFKMKYGTKETNLDYVCKSLHHELYHYFDYKMDDLIYGGDPIWEAFNIEGFQYGNGGVNNREYKTLEFEIPGFFNFYSTTAVEEDKAEIFKYLIVETEALLNHKDEIVRKKAVFIKTELEGYDPAVNDEWWEFLKTVKKTRTYVNGEIAY